MRPIRAHETAVELPGEIDVGGVAALALKEAVVLAPAFERYGVGCGVDCHAMNFQPFGVLVQALRNTSLRLRGWPLISASIAARSVTNTVSPATRTIGRPAAAQTSPLAFRDHCP